MNEFAKFTRTLRLENDEHLGHMAKKIGVSSAFLSRVENGLAKPSEKILRGICQNYSLSQKQIESFEKIVEDARQKISLSSLPQSKQQLIIRFAQSIDKFDDNDLKELEEIISRKR